MKNWFIAIGYGIVRIAKDIIVGGIIIGLAVYILIGSNTKDKMALYINYGMALAIVMFMLYIAVINKKQELDKIKPPKAIRKKCKINDGDIIYTDKNVKLISIDAEQEKSVREKWCFKGCTNYDTYNDKCLLDKAKENECIKKNGRHFMPPIKV